MKRGIPSERVGRIMAALKVAQDELKAEAGERVDDSGWGPPKTLDGFAEVAGVSERLEEVQSGVKAMEVCE